MGFIRKFFSDFLIKNIPTIASLNAKVLWKRNALEEKDGDAA